MTLAKLIGTFMGVGYIRPAPGTWGSLAALPYGWLLHVIGGLPLLLIGIAVGFLKGWWATAQMTKGSDDHDPSEIVVDEVIGQWIALIPLSYAAGSLGISILNMWPGWIAAFALFRLFDITKPWIIGWADRRGDALGVMLDDVIAGVFAAIGVMVLAALFHGVM
ncbi:phosphatidylglycerophosphatase A [Sulfitobacter mediterraneus]|jgi:phosphatidylglycerophosphatase A|uniref:phosphatidylglycerophosphatase A family protein n=1 Tax=Sulfitobacter TaxID=60136 RepID=UPI0019329D25|nr:MULTISPECIES: phosphatidylglycerophosphatase A [Sulfitobacter]MBM1631988.1 phosphatidylglycerophosphatase A [Sulfitobacter mediterraneus]MBM1639803.1 phosphatidylglycerophosphatase A [Sulfitobacter mediterraneus]MBM1643852.1 phosphatidylglycerophosphatase A [Sulfitobacter mediterraneus]MBM1647898.1 phosphatidylglycerophosphatase A [Sulfitobacter mediterraneus]MBM1651943.1 phosphatidylglycerophosphatase A [Sulfitobacter mediterraneus]